MSLISNIKNSFALTAILLLFTACGGGGGSTSSSLITSGETSTTSIAKTVHSGQVKDSSTGNGLSNVKVSLGDSSTTTDKNGFYTLSELIANEEAVINFEKEGYLLGSTHILLKSLSEDDTTSSNYLEYDMYSHDYQLEIDSDEEVASSRITIDTSVSYRNTLEKPYSGTMTVELSILDNDEEAFIACYPGEFKGINTNGTLIQFESYGLISILLKDSYGNRLSFEDGKTATLTFNTISSLEKPNTLPLWYYDYAQGLWFEEGYAELQEDGSYRGEISHLGTWSLNKPIEDEPGIYRGRIVYADGTPAQDIRLHAIGNNWSSSDLSTNDEGIFEINVIPGSSFKLSAYDYKNKYGANYNGIIAAITSGDIVEDRI